MEKNEYVFSYTNYEEIDTKGKQNGIVITGPYRISRIGMFRYCWPGCLTVMYDAENIGIIQIKDIKKNNDYAMWLKVCKKADCYLLNETLAQYRKGRQGSISTHKKIELIKWHYKLFTECEGYGKIRGLFCTVRNIVFGLLKKKRYVKRY